MAEQMMGTWAISGDCVLNTMTGRYHRVLSIRKERDSNGDLVLIVTGSPSALVAKYCEVVDLPNDADLADPESLELWLTI